MAELQLYRTINGITASILVGDIEALRPTERLTLRMDTEGGNVFKGWAIAGKIAEHRGQTTAKLEGAVRSMGTFLLPFFDRVEALDVSNIHLHRAEGPIQTQQDRDFLDKINSDLRSKFESYIDTDALQRVSGYSLDDIFNSEQRIDVFLTAQQANEVGIVDEVKTLDREMEAEACGVGTIEARKTDEPEPSTNSEKQQRMNTLEELKAQYPELVAEAKNEGINEERSRVKAFTKWVNTDAKYVAEAIENGTEFTAEHASELYSKAAQATAQKDVEDDSPEDVTPDPEAKDNGEEENKDTELEALAKKVDPDWAEKEFGKTS